MIAQPTLSCHNTTNRVFWEWYASFMVLIYPVGVPLLFFVILFLHRGKIKRVMLVKKCLVSPFEKGQALEYDIPKMFPDPKEQRRVKVHTEALLKVLEHVDEAVKAAIAEANRQQLAAAADAPDDASAQQLAAAADAPDDASASPSDAASSDGDVCASDDILSVEEQHRIKTLIELSKSETHELFIDVAKGETFDDVAIRMIAYADSMFHGSQTSAGGHKLMKLKSTLQNDPAMIETGPFNISPVLLAMQQYFEKYEGRVYW